MRIKENIIIPALALLCTLANAQDSSVTFDSYRWNFGTVYESEGIVSHGFTFKNISDGAISISRTNPSCTCIQAQYAKQEVPAGGTSEITVSFTPSGASGETFRNVEVFDNRNQCVAVLEIEANVIPADRTIQERYFYPIGAMVYLSRTNIPFGYLYKGQQVAKTTFIANASSEPVSIGIEKHPNRHLTVDCPATIAPGGEVPVTLTYTLPDDEEIFATMTDTLRLTIDGEKALADITTKALCLKTLQPSDERPVMRTYPSAAPMKEGEITIYNDGTGDLEIYYVEIPAGVAANVTAGTVICPNGKLVVKAKSRSKADATLHLFTNDPVRPYKELIFN